MGGLPHPFQYFVHIWGGNEATVRNRSILCMEIGGIFRLTSSLMQ